MKTLAIRLEDDLHARLTLLSKLTGSSVTATIRNALEQHLAGLIADPVIAAKASELTAAIEQEAEAQRQTLAALFASGEQTKPTRRSPAPTME